MMHQRLGWTRAMTGVSILVTVAVLASACGSTDEPTEPAAEPDGVTGEGDVTVDDAVERLAAAGIAVFLDDGGDAIVDPVEPVSPVRLLRWQARNMALEAASGGGILGSDLDTLVVPDPEHPDAPPPAQFLAAYVHGVETPGAELARELVGDQDLTQPEGVVFPTMVVTLFASDLARAAEELADGDSEADREGEGAAGVVDIGDAQPISSTQAICPDFAGFLNQMIDDVVRILKRERILVPDTGIPILNSILQAGADLFVGFLNFAIDAAAKLVIGAFTVALQPVFSIVTTIAAVFAVLSAIKSAVSPWVLRTTGDEDPAHRGVGAPATRELTLRVEIPEPTEWPEFIQSCAKAIQLELPPLRPRGGKVTWTSVDPRAATSIASQDGTLDDESSARLVLDLGQETRRQHTTGGPEQHTLVTVTAKVSRQEVEDFKNLVRGLIGRLFANLPGLLQQHLVYYSTHAIDGVLDEISNRITDIPKVTYLHVTFHGDAEDDKDGPPLSAGEDDVCGLVTDEEISEFLDFPVVSTTYNADSHADGSGVESCIRGDFDAALATEDFNAFISAAFTETAYLNLALYPPQGQTFVDAFAAEATGTGAQPVDGIGDLAFSAGGGDEAIIIYLLVGDRAAVLTIWRYGTPGSMSDHLEIARIVADRMR